MYVGAGLVMIAVGAVMSFAVTLPSNRYFDWVAAGVVLMVVGALSVAVSLLQAGLMANPGRARRRYVRNNAVWSEPGHRGGPGPEDGPPDGWRAEQW